MVHVPWHTARVLRRHGWKADYLAVGESPYWSQCDYLMPKTNPLTAAWREFWVFWTVMARYEVVHFHFMLTMTRSGWEVPLLKRMGRRVVAHFRGCEARDRDLNMRLHPRLNICEQCDYQPPICTNPLSQRRRGLAAKWADATLVTTPDMLDFIPGAVVSSFFAPVEVFPNNSGPWDGQRPLKLVHVTNHPGIEGTKQIRLAVDAVRARGFEIQFIHLRDVNHAEVMRTLREADLAIGKMKMGFYANSQIESMACGVPTITWVRPEFMTEKLHNSGFIICHLDNLEQTLVAYMSDPGALQKKRELARTSILNLHDEDTVIRSFIQAYTKSN
ncbi:hypothetical protein CHR62_14445 [Pusillimonas sp. NJUB218]|nr:hypothetical protein CHR62_14445 [Pusillimonas sp. NJUB218]